MNTIKEKIISSGVMMIAYLMIGFILFTLIATFAMIVGMI